MALDATTLRLLIANSHATAPALQQLLNNSIYPANRAMGAWLADQDAKQQAQLEQFEQLSGGQGRPATAAPAPAPVPQRNPLLDGIDAYNNATTPAEPEGATFGQLFGRGVDETQATLANVGAALADVVGWDKARDWMREQAVEQQKQAEEVPLDPGTQELFGEEGAIATGNIGGWAKQTLARNLPQLLMSGGVAGLGAKTATKLGLSKLFGAGAGIGTSTAALEAGSAYDTDVQQHGIENTSPGRDLAVGAVNGAVEIAFGAEMGLAKALLGKAALKPGALRAAKSLIKKTVAKGVMGGTKEAFTEATQEAIQGLNELVGGEVDGDLVHRVMESAAAGALVGGPLGVVTPANTTAPAPKATPVAPATPLTVQESGIPDTLGNAPAEVNSPAVIAGTPAAFATSPDSFLNSEPAAFESADNDFLGKSGVVKGTPSTIDYVVPQATPQEDANNKLKVVQDTFERTKDDTQRIYDRNIKDIDDQFAAVVKRMAAIAKMPQDQQQGELAFARKEQFRLAALKSAFDKQFKQDLESIKKEQDKQFAAITKTLMTQLAEGSQTGAGTAAAAKELTKLTAEEVKLEKARADTIKERAKEKQEQSGNSKLRDMDTKLAERSTSVPPTIDQQTASLKKKLATATKLLQMQQKAITDRAEKLVGQKARPQQVANTLAKMKAVEAKYQDQVDVLTRQVSSITGESAPRPMRASNASNPNLGKVNFNLRRKVQEESENLERVSQALNQEPRNQSLLAGTPKTAEAHAAQLLDASATNTTPSPEVTALRGESGPLATFIRKYIERLEKLGLKFDNLVIVDNADFNRAQIRMQDGGINTLFFNVAASLGGSVRETMLRIETDIMHEVFGHFGLNAIGQTKRHQVLKSFHKILNTKEVSPLLKEALTNVDFEWSVPSDVSKINIDKLDASDPWFRTLEEMFAKLTNLPRVRQLVETRISQREHGQSFIDKFAKLWQDVLKFFRSFRPKQQTYLARHDEMLQLFDGVTTGLLAFWENGGQRVDVSDGVRQQVGLKKTSESYSGRTVDTEQENMTRAQRAEAAAAQGLISEFPSIKQGWDYLSTPEGREAFYKSLEETAFDSLSPIRRMIKDLKKRTGNENAKGEARVSVDSNVYKYMEGLPNITNLRLRQANSLYVEPILQKIAEMSKQLGEDTSVTFANATDYLEALTALERNNYYAARAKDQSAKNIHYLTEVNPVARVKNSKARETIARLSSPDMDELVQLVQKLNNARLEELEKNHIISPETAATWREAYTHYMPLKGWENVIESEVPNWYKGTTRRSLSTPNDLRKIKARVTGGGDLEAQNPLIKSFMQFFDTINLVEKAKAGRVLLKLVENNPDATDVFEVVQTRNKENSDSWQGLKVRVNDSTGELELTKTLNTAEGRAENVISVIADNSEIVPILIKDEGIAKAFKGSNIVQAQGIIRQIGNLSNTLARAITSRNPMFWAVNPLRDAVTAYLNMGSVTKELESLGVVSPKKIATAIITKGIGRAFSNSSVRKALLDYYRTGKMDFTHLNERTSTYMADLSTFMDYGGQTEYFTTSTYRSITQDVQERLKRMNPTNRIQHVKSTLHNVFNYMDAISDSLENMTRYITFKEIADALRASNKPNPDGTYTRSDGKILTEHEINSRAANVALNLTVNFSKKGSWAPVFNSLYMFASASIGGNIRMLKTLFQTDENGKLNKNNLLKFALVPTGAYFIMSTLARSFMPDDDDGINMYDKIPDYIKNTSLIIPSPFMDGGYVKLPLPYGFNVLWALGRGIVDSAYSAATGNKIMSPVKAATNLFDVAFDNFAAIGQSSEGLDIFIPSILRPLYQLSSNKNFAGAPIKPAPTGLQKGEVPDSSRYWSTANDAVVWVCKELNKLTGGSANRSGAIDWSPESLEHLYTAYTGGLGKLAAQAAGRLTDLYEGKALDVGKLPLTSIFYKEITPQDTAAIFAKYRTEVQTQINEVEGAKANAGLSTQERMRVFESSKAGITLQKTLNDTQYKLNKLRQHEKMLDASNISMEAKQTRLEAIKKQKQALMKLFIKRARTTGVEVND